VLARSGDATDPVTVDAQPPAQPHSGVVVDRPVRFGDGTYFEVVRPKSLLRAGILMCDFCNGLELFLDGHSEARIYCLDVANFLQTGEPL
jgi:hypothetical protein